MLLYSPPIFFTNILNSNTSVSSFSFLYANITHNNILQNLTLSTIERYTYVIYLQDKSAPTIIYALSVAFKRIRIYGGDGGK